MSAQILDGKKLAQNIKLDLQKEVLEMKISSGAVPHLKNILLGEDPGSCAYANSQKKVAEEIGLKYELVNLSEDISQEDLINFVNELNNDDSVNGIMLHKPVPSQIDYRAVGNYIDVKKDLEGINTANVGKMLLGETRITPCTPAAVMEHIKSTSVDLKGKEAVIVGHSEIVGKPLSLLLLQEDATVTVCHAATSKAGRLEEHIARADVLVVAVGKPYLIKGNLIKKGAIVVDVGINKVDGEIIGDVEYPEARKRAAYITPVPGGVGPVTVVMLMKNGIEAYKMQTNNGGK